MPVKHDAIKEDAIKEDAMETSLHQQLKHHYAGSQRQTEVALGSYRIDAIRDDELIEIQCASLSAIRDKTVELLKRHRLRIVKPIAIRTRILKSKTKTSKITSRRLSPKRGSTLEIFEELIYFTRVFPHENLTIEVPLVHVQQHRIPAHKRRRRRWGKDYQVADVHLESIGESLELRNPSDLLELAGIPPHLAEFNTADLAKILDRPRWVAQKVAYVLRHTNAIQPDGRNRSGIIYRAA